MAFQIPLPNRFLRMAIIGLVASCLSLPVAGNESCIPDLKQWIQSLESGNDLDKEHALIEIAKRGPKASSAVDALCKNLESPNYSVRGLSVDALVAIGEPAISTLKDLLDSPNPIVRAATLQALGRLNAIKVEQVLAAAKDPDPRVRAAVAISLANCNQAEAVDPLVQLVSDDEPAVALQACLALKQRRAYLDKVIPALTEALSRLEIADAVVQVLSEYGTDAQPAIPKLLEVSTQIENHAYYNYDIVSKAMEHIGPPAVADLDRICKLLGPQDHERTMLVADSLSRLGGQGKSAAKPLEAAVHQLVRHAVETRIKYADADEEIVERFDDSGRVEVAAENCIAAFWQVTRDSKRFIELVEKLARECKTRVSFSSPNPWTQFSQSDIQYLAILLNSTDLSVLNSGVYAIIDLGPKAMRHVERVVELLDVDFVSDYGQVERALGGMGKMVAQKSVPALIKSYRDGHTELDVFARSVENTETGLVEFESILVNGLNHDDEWTVAASANALCRTGSDPEKSAKLVIKAVELRRCSSRQAIEALRRLDMVPNVVVDFLIVCLSDGDNWTRHDAAIALGRLGEKSKSAVDSLKLLLDAEYFEERLQAAKAIYLITGDSDQFDRFLETELANKKNDRGQSTQIIEAIGELGPDGARFLLRIDDLLKRYIERDSQVEIVCEALRNIGNDKTVQLLTKISQSKDWEAKSAANAALASIKKSNQPESSK